MLHTSVATLISQHQLRLWLRRLRKWNWNNFGKVPFLAVSLLLLLALRVWDMWDGFGIHLRSEIRYRWFDRLGECKNNLSALKQIFTQSRTSSLELTQTNSRNREVNKWFQKFFLSGSYRSWITQPLFKTFVKLRFVTFHICTTI